MSRARMLAAALFALAGCAKPEPPIGYTPASPTESGRDDAPPTGGGGFDFGAALETVRARCGAQKGELEHSGKVSICSSRHADISATKLTLLQYCGGAVCRIHSLVILDRSDARTWLTSFEYLRRELQRRYGTPDANQTQFPAECETTFAQCVRDERASATVRWRWADGHAILLRIGATDQVPAAISVSYESPEGAK